MSIVSYLGGLVNNINPFQEIQGGTTGYNWNGSPSSSDQNFAYDNISSYPQSNTSLVTPSAAPAPSGTSGGGTGTAATDPFAAWGGQTAYNNLVSGFNTQHQNVSNSANDAASNAATGIHGSILDLLDNLTAGQRDINTAGMQNELSKIQGTNNVNASLGRNVKSGGVMLANKNAGSSSATEALARAYGEIARQQQAQVGNQYVTGLNDINTKEQDLNTHANQGVRHIQDSKTQTVNSIINDARNQLASLDAQIASANLPQRIAIDQEKENIRAQVLNTLSQYDSLLGQGVTNAITPNSVDERKSAAFKANAEGVPPANAFTFDQTPAAQFQGTGPFASSLPLFTLPTKNKDAAAAQVVPAGA